MQLHLTLAELRLLADILEEKRFALSLANSAAGSAPDSGRRLQELEELLAKVSKKSLAFSADEFFSISDILSEVEREWSDRLAVSGDSATVAKIGRNNALLQSLKDKIVECCAMV